MAKYRASFLRRGKWWVAWTDDLPGALTQGRTLDQARENLKDAISLMRRPLSARGLPPSGYLLSAPPRPARIRGNRNRRKRRTCQSAYRYFSTRTP